MKKTNTLLLLIAFMAVSSISLLNAQVPDGYYKKYHIDQNFNGLEAVPTGWSINSSTTALFRSGGIAVADGVVKATGSGGGSRGVDLVFPSPQSNSLIGQPADSIWYFEMDWIINGATLGQKNALGLLIAGSKSQSIATANYYADGIFGLYTFGDGFLHYSNLDLQGPLKHDIDSTFTGDPNERYGPAINSGQYPGFGRAAADAATAALINASTKTTIPYAAGKSYHITAILNFSTQKVVKLIITDNADPLNTQTFENHAFLAPSMASATSVVPVEQRKVTDIAIIGSVNTRSTWGTIGNGGNAALNVNYDNIQIYRPELSLGQTNVTINYKDRQGGTAKAARTVEKQEVSTIFNLLMSDKEGFIEGGNYYAYDAEATHAANAGKGNNDGESVVVASGASLDVVFKKSTLTAGTYVWTGANGFNWSELEDNFSVSGGAAMSFQNGNAAAFSDANAANKEIKVPANLVLGEGNFTISTAGYSFSGTGRLEGTGSLIIDAPTALGIDNRLTGGALINTSEQIQINHAGAATKYATTLSNINLRLEPKAAFTAAITGNGGVLNIDAISDNAYTPVIKGFNTVNLSLANVGKGTNNSWSDPFTSVFTDTSVVVNVINSSEQDTLPITYAVAPTSVALAKVHLGDGTRLIHNGTPGSKATISVKIGELSGSEYSSLEGNSVCAEDRTIEYVIGGLNTDAVFNGKIRPQLTKFPSRHVGTELVYLPETTEGDTTWYIPAPLKLKKVGKGSWTANGEMLFGGDITVDEGTMVIGNSVAASVTQIKVDTAAVLVAKNIVAATGITVNIGTLSGSITANSISLTGSKLKLNANSFAEGQFDKITTIGDFTTIAAVNPEDLNILDITVKAANKDEKIKIIEVQGNADVSFNKIMVNGEDITSNTPQTTGAKFAFIWDEATNSGELLSMTDFVTALDQVPTEKAIRSELYYNATGQVVSKNDKGFLIKITTYTDGTKKIEKTIEFDR